MNHAELESLFTAARDQYAPGQDLESFLKEMCSYLQALNEQRNQNTL